jgi:deoxyribodipyrimidine photo-lyase
MTVAVVLFNRDLRVHDHPALHAAVSSADQVVPLFVVDDVIVSRSSPNRVRFLLECLDDLRRSLQERGGDLVVRHGDIVTEAAAVAREVGADVIHASEDVSAFAQRRQRRLAGTGTAVELHPGVTIVPPGDLLPSGGGGHYRVFTPYFGQWSQIPWRDPVPAPTRIAVPDIDPGDVPAIELRAISPSVAVTGGEHAALAHLDNWLGDPVWDALHTSRVSAHLKFGCLSPLTLARRVQAGGWEQASDYVRQLCWRDFFHQVVADFPAITTDDYRPRTQEQHRRWSDDDDAFAAWKQGRTGVPLVDAGMRQLLAEGWMPNRARMVAASYLTKTLGIDWRRGAAHFSAWLVDGDIACNYGNWQWAAGTGNDTRPNRTINPHAQAKRHDPDGDYVRTWAAS